MKNISVLVASILFVIFSVRGTAVFAQKSTTLPDHVSLSFNGTFTNDFSNNIDQLGSANGVYFAKYEIGDVTHENREIKNFRLYKSGDLQYALNRLQGADFYISNSGYVAVMNMDREYLQELSVVILNPQGDEIFTKKYRYASLFGFSPKGKQIVVGTDKLLEVINCQTLATYQVDRASQFAFSEKENILVTAFENQMSIYKNHQKLNTIQTDLFYPRSVVVSEALNTIGVIGKKEFKTYSLENFALQNVYSLEEHHSFRELKIYKEKIFAGVHFRHEGISAGLLYEYAGGLLESKQKMAEKQYETFEQKYKSAKNKNGYETIPWPFVPFDEVHKVWNHYEQHMGDGSGDWAYLHQGLDLETPIAEPTYAVEAGVVKCVLTLGGEVYWRVAVSPEQVSGYSDGWLYAHLIPSSIQVDVGDEIELHDYIGDIIAWTSTWGHIHFVNIKDQGTVWYYNDDEWGINFNPLLALDPITDNVAPVIDDFSEESKFGFIANQSTNILDPAELSGDVDIIVKISDFHGDSEWEQPAFKTYYWFNKLPENTMAFPKTLGQILNHSYPMYNSGFYQSYAPILYFKDFAHPSPPWMNLTRDYYQILTNNNGDSIIDLSESALAFKTADFDDGIYRLYVEAWDEFGNMAIDSQDVVFDNFNTGIISKSKQTNSLKCFPNPAGNNLSIQLPDAISTSRGSITVFNSQLKLIRKEEFSSEITANHIKLNTESLKPGMYILEVKTGKETFSGKFVKR